MQDTSNVVTRWAITLHDFRHVPGKLSILPDTLYHLFGEANANLVLHDPALTSTCRSFCGDRTYDCADPHVIFRYHPLVARTVTNPSQMIVSRLQVPSTCSLVRTLMTLSSCKTTRFGDYLDVCLLKFPGCRTARLQARASFLDERRGVIPLLPFQAFTETYHVS